MSICMHCRSIPLSIFFCFILCLLLAGSSTAETSEVISAINQVMKLSIEANIDDQIGRTDSSDKIYSITGELRKWHTVKINFKGPDTTEAAVGPNPFTDYRLQVQFTSPNDRKYNVPGFYAGDGEGRGSGNIWRVCFSPGEVGKWLFVASFRKGPKVAVSVKANAGEATAFDGCRGSFFVEQCDKNAPGFLKWGRQRNHWFLQLHGTGTR